MAHLPFTDSDFHSSEKTLEEIKPKLAALLKRNGYNTPEELDAKVEQVLKGDELRKYRETRER